MAASGKLITQLAPLVAFALAITMLNEKVVAQPLQAQLALAQSKTQSQLALAQSKTQSQLALAQSQTQAQLALWTLTAACERARACSAAAQRTPQRAFPRPQRFTFCSAQQEVRRFFAPERRSTAPARQARHLLQRCLNARQLRLRRLRLRLHQRQLRRRGVLCAAALHARARSHAAVNVQHAAAPVKRFILAPRRRAAHRPLHGCRAAMTPQSNLRTQMTYGRTAVVAWWGTRWMKRRRRRRR
jgi:hypothetical protein